MWSDSVLYWSGSFFSVLLCKGVVVKCVAMGVGIGADRDAEFSYEKRNRRLPKWGDASGFGGICRYPTSAEVVVGESPAAEGADTCPL